MELPHIGEVCVICRRNDYLPFKCSHCDKIVCIDHKTNHGDECPLNTDSFLAPEVSNSDSLHSRCDYCKKITLNLELVTCTFCEKNYCLSHRHQIQHSCSHLEEVRQQRYQDDERRNQIRSDALANLKTTSTKNNTNITPKSQSRPFVDPKKLALAKRIRIMSLKQSAKGPPNVLEEDKIFFKVRFEHHEDLKLSNKSKHDSVIKIFATPRHTLGRIVDWISTELSLINKNNLAGSEELTLCKNDDRSELCWFDNQKTFSDYLDNNQIEDGDDLIIRYRANS